MAVIATGVLKDQVSTALFPVRFGAMLLVVLGLAGLATMGLGALSLLVPIWNKVFNDVSIIRSPMLHLSMMLELIGVQFISMGLLGEVLSRTYFESQGKKAYAVRQTLNLEKKREQRRAA